VSAITLRSRKNIKVLTPEPTPHKEVDPAATNQRKHDDAHVARPSTSVVPSPNMPSTSVAPSIPLPSLQELFQTRRWKRLTRRS